MGTNHFGDGLKPVVKLAVLLLAVPLFVFGQVPVREQVIPLEAGWNAVYLEVDPVDPELEVLFGGLPVDRVAAYLRPASSAQFIANPGVDLFRRSGWAVWYAPGGPDHFLSTLHAVHGPKAYLVHATEATVWRVRGGIEVSEVRWQPDSFNFVGFGVRSRGAPTFEQFFAGSRAHRHNRIYRLRDGVWRQVQNPAAEAMRSGEAFWIYTEGSSRYQGPLRVEAPAGRGLVLGARPGGVVLRNQVDHPVAAIVEHVPGDAGGLALAMVLRAVGDPSALVRSVSAPKPMGAWAQVLPPLEAGAYVRVPMELRADAGGGVGAWSLLRIVTDLGTESWVPVWGSRKEGNNP